ncbi:MAG: ribonuclease P protein component [Bdellovibrionales bacterium]|nr:ribonuclease P protein component [Bdellovibrionales bacterium]
MADSGFEKNFRLLSARDFEELKVGSSSYKKAALIVYYKKNPFNQTRIGISTPKKIGKSHDRNRLKRLIREYFRLSPYKFLGTDILLVVSWSRNLLPQSSTEKESMLQKNLGEFFHFLEDEKSRSR